MEYIYNAIISADQEHNKKDYHEIMVFHNVYLSKQSKQLV